MKQAAAAQARGFHSYADCQTYARKLAACRVQELSTGATGQYRDYCADYRSYSQSNASSRAAQQRAGQSLANRSSSSANRSSSGSADRTSGSSTAMTFKTFYSNHKVG